MLFGHVHHCDAFTPTDVLVTALTVEWSEELRVDVVVAEEESPEQQKSPE